MGNVNLNLKVPALFDNIRYNEMGGDGYQRLGAATILLACLDYEELSNIERDDRRYDAAQIEMNRIRKFFGSDLFDLMNPTSISGNGFLHYLDKYDM